MKKILITGDEGFIGSNLRRYLENLNYTVIGLDIKSGNDILDCELPDCDLVVHLAGIGGVRESMSDPKKYWYNNVEGTKRILEYYFDKRVLVAGSSSQYEPHLNPYAASKHVIESISHQNTVFMRLHTVYGPDSREGMFFSKLLNGTLEYVTDHERDFIHIEDVLNFIYVLINSDFVGPIDVGTGRSVKISKIKKDLPIQSNTLGERYSTLADIENMRKLGYTARITVEDFLSGYII